jgi:hypothetical protein
MFEKGLVDMANQHQQQGAVAVAEAPALRVSSTTRRIRHGIPMKPVLYGILGAIAASLGVAPLSPVTRLPGMRTIDVLLTSGSDPSDEVGLVMGPSGISTPSQSYVDTANALYLQPNGFTGTPQALTTPETFDLNRGPGEEQGATDLVTAVQQQIANGDVSPDNPVYVFGYSQSSALSGIAMNQLNAAGVPSDDVHFVLVGDPGAPDGGVYTAFGVIGGSFPDDLTPSDLYPTDVYTLEYDPVGDFPNYPIDLLSDLNSLIGLFTEHLAYLGLTSEQIADAAQLTTSAADTMTDYYVIPSDTLPLLLPLELIPVIGKPLYDLLEPTMQTLVDLGYGSLDEGYNQGPADVETTIGLFPPNSFDLLLGLPAALGADLIKGITDFGQDLLNPATYTITPPVDSPALSTLETAAYNAGFIDTPHPSSILQLLDALGTLLSGADVESGTAAAEPASLASDASNLLDVPMPTF